MSCLAPNPAALVFLLALTSCDAAPPSEPIDGGVDAGPEDGATLLTDGEALFWRALAGETSLRRESIRTLERGLELEPDHPRGALIYAMAMLSALAEDGDFTYAALLEPAFLHAIEVNPDDRRIPGWLGTVRVAMARVLMQEEQLGEAIDYLMAAADAYPEFNNFSLAIAFAKLPLDTPYPELALARLESIVDCGETTDVCRNDNVPHNIEGSLMTFGDLHARLGHRDEARAFYQQALDAEDAATWPHRAAAQAVLDDLDARINRFLDDDPENDPLFFSEGETSCVGCHAP